MKHHPGTKGRGPAKGTVRGKYPRAKAPGAKRAGAKAAPRPAAKTPPAPRPRRAPPPPPPPPAPPAAAAAAPALPSWRDRLKLPPPQRAGFVALLGRPNVGKSTLLNRLVGTKLAATTPKPQTTRRRFRAFLTLPNAQLILVDTPGLFDAALQDGEGRGGYGELGSYMAKQSRAVLADVDAVVWVEEAGAFSAEGPTPAQAALAALVRQGGRPCVLAVNKVDTVKAGSLLPALAAWKDALPFAAMVPVSAIREDGLDRLVRELAALLPESPLLFPGDDLTDQSERAVCEELIREKAMMRTGEEVPYAVAVEIQKFDESRRAGDDQRPGIVEIDADIHVERPGQKAIVVGVGGAKIKEIGIEARRDLERFLGCRVMLRLFVKVTEHWSRSALGLRNLGYS
ncbi:MAG: GTPase Era [Deltaproteobacteria bacterium]|nr:GTPase Era [Deltaproteobacteria bacterium]